MAKPTGLGNTGSMLLRPSTVPDEGRTPPARRMMVLEESRGELAAESQETPARSKRTKRTAPAGKTKARNLHLTEDVHDRLWFLARQRKQTFSAVANDLLDRALPL